MEQALNDSIEFARALPTPVLVAGGIVFVLLALGIVFSFRKPPAHLTAFASEAGTVLVSRKALQELIRQACLKDASVEAAKATVRISEKQIDTKIILRLATADNLKQTTERVQAAVTSLLRRSLSFDQVGQIQIVVTGFSRDVDSLGEPEETGAPSVLTPKPTREGAAPHRAGEASKPKT